MSGGNVWFCANAGPAARHRATAKIVFMRRILPPNRAERGLNRGDFVAVHGVPHPFIDTFVNAPSQPAKDVGRLVNSCERNMRIDVAAAEQNGRAVQRSFVAARRARWADEAATQAEH